MTMKISYDKWLQDLRQEAEITPVELTEQLGLDNVRQVKILEEGGARVPFFLYPGLARTFGMTIRDFAKLCLIHEELGRAA